LLSEVNRQTGSEFVVVVLVIITIIITVVSVKLFRVAHHAAQNNSADGRLQAPMNKCPSVTEQQVARRAAERVGEH